MSFNDRIKKLVEKYRGQTMKSPGRADQSITERAAELIDGYIKGSTISIAKEFRSCSQYLVGPVPNSSQLSRAAHVFAYLHESYLSTDSPTVKERDLYMNWITNQRKEKQPEPDYRNVIRELIDGFKERNDSATAQKFESFVNYCYGPDPSSGSLQEAAPIFAFYEIHHKGQPIPLPQQAKSYASWKSWYGTNAASSKSVPAKEDSPAKLKAIEAMRALTPDELGEVLDYFLLVNDGPEPEEVPTKGSCSGSSAGPTFTGFKMNDFLPGPTESMKAMQEAFNKMATKMAAEAEAQALPQTYTQDDDPAIPYWMNPFRGSPVPKGYFDGYIPPYRPTAPTLPQKRPEAKSQESTQQSQEPKYAFKSGQSVWYSGPAKSGKTKGRILEIKGLKAVVRLGEDACAYNVKLIELEPAEEEV